MKPGRNKLLAEFEDQKVFVKCPECGVRQELDLSFFRVDSRGQVWPWFVCGVTVCDFEGQIWLVNWGD